MAIGNRDIMFERLYKDNYTVLFYRALDIVEDEDVAADLVESLFADIWERFDQVRADEAPKYLMKSLKNKCVSYLRHKAVERKYEQQFLQMKEEMADEDDEVHEERLRIVDEVIESQTAQRKFVFQQCCLEGKSYGEVAAILNLSVSSIHKHVSKVYAELRKSLFGR